MIRLPGLLCVLLIFFANSVFGQTLAQCQADLNEINDIAQIAQQQIQDLQTITANKDKIIEKHKAKITLLEKRIQLLESGEGKSDEMIELLKQNQELCLSSENQAYELMQKIMVDYREAVNKATRPWFLDPSFYGGILIGALMVAVL